MRQSNNKSTQFSVSQADDGMPLLAYVMKSLHGISRTKAKAILSGGGIRVNGQFTTQHDQPLRVGMRVDISKRKPRAVLQSQFVRLVYEDRHLLVIDKQPGILSMGNEHQVFCVKTVLDDYLQKSHSKCTAHVVHRLDRDTSGLMVYAKTIEAQQILEEHWHEIVSDRRYIAVVSGRMEQKSGAVESWLKDNKAFVTYSSHVPGDGKYALTHFKVLRLTDKHSLVELRLETGRKNQIRVHMHDLGHPVCGDVKYGGAADNPCHRLCLHAFRLHFRHPITGEPLRFDTPTPQAFKDIFRRLPSS